MHTICVLGRARSEALLTDQSRRLVTKTASNLHTLQNALGESTVSIGARRRNNLGQPELVAVKIEEAQEVVIVLTGVKVHEHGS